MLDDAGWSDLGCYGSEIRTPNIDGLAATGVRYVRFDTRALCSPTRAALLTGRNNQTVRMGDLPSRLRAPDPTDLSPAKGELPRDVTTLPEVLRQSGYGTFAVGKWHLSPAYEGGPDESGPGGRTDPGGAKSSWPLQRGFDRYYGFLGGWTSHWAPDLVEDNRLIPRPTTPGYHLSEDLVDRAIDFLDAGARSAKPTFLYLALGAPHSPLHPPPAWLKRYAGAYDDGWEALRETRLARQKTLGVVPRDTVLSPWSPEDPSWAGLAPAERQVHARSMEAFAAFLEHADAQIGRLVDHLRAAGRLDDTLVLLMSDNGAAAEGGRDGGFLRPYSDATPLADRVARLDELGGAATSPLYSRAWARAGSTPFGGHKATLQAGGLRAPLVLSWTNGIQARGAVRGQPVDVTDIAPTLLEVAGARFPETRNGVRQLPVVGRSVRATFDSDQAVTREAQFFELRAQRAIRLGDWRAVASHTPGRPFGEDRWKLFNSAADFSESVDLAESFPAKLAQLEARWWTEARRHADPPLAEYIPPRLRRPIDR